MAEVDHAMLARFACVEADGSLTVVGGHRSVFEVAGLPSQHVLCVAGRLLVARREPPPVLGLAALTPQGEVPDVATWTVEVPRERAVGGRLPVSFAVTLVAPAPGAGAYALAFTVVDVHEPRGARAARHDAALTGPRPPG